MRSDFSLNSSLQQYSSSRLVHHTTTHYSRIQKTRTKNIQEQGSGREADRGRLRSAHDYCTLYIRPLAMSRVNNALDDLDPGYVSGSCSGDESVEIEIGIPESESTRSLSSAVEDVELTVGVNPAPTRSADDAVGAAAAKARQPSIARLFTSKQAPTPQQQRAKEKRAEQRQRDDDVDDAALLIANLTAPARAAHIDKTRVVRSHAKVRAARRRAAEEEEEEENGSASAGKKPKVPKLRFPKKNGGASGDACPRVSTAVNNITISRASTETGINGEK